MNTNYILNKTKPFLINKKLSEDVFFELFGNLEKKEQYEILNIFIENGIDITFDDTEIFEEENKLEVNEYSIINNARPLDLEQISKLSNEQLCLLYQNGDDRILDILYLKNKRFIYMKAIKLYIRYNHKLDIDDLVEYGIFGLIKAAKKFKIENESKFLTYAGHWITQSITRAIADYGFTIRIPVHLFENINYIYNLMRVSGTDDVSEVIELVCDQRQVSKSKALEWIQISNNILNLSSLNMFVGDSEDIELVELLENHQKSVDKLYEELELNKIITCEISKLNKRDIDIINKRFGFDCDPMTLEEIGDEYNITRERVRQIEKKAIMHLKRNYNISSLRIYLED